jgi:hypothetical protein
MSNEMTRMTLLLLCLSSMLRPIAAHATFAEDFPSLSKYVFEQSASKIFFGGGLTPISVMNQKPDIALSIFQAHWITDYLDFELFNGMIGFSYLSSANSYSLTHFTFRTVPKFRLTHNISVGPLVGIEFVSFPGVTGITAKGGFVTPNQSFSTSGLIYGAVVSETFPIGKQYMLKINQTAYKQNYSTVSSSYGWQYVYDNTGLNADQSPIAPGMVFQLEFSFLY